MSSQLNDAFNEAVERRVRMLRAAELVESWSCCGQTFTGSSDFISGVRAVHTCPPEDVPDAETAYAMGKADAASPDERLREALRVNALLSEQLEEARRWHLTAVNAKLAAQADAERLFTALDGYIMARITGTDLRDYDDLAERAARAHRALATDVPGKPDGTSVPDQTRRIVVYEGRHGRGGLDVPVGCTVGEAALLAAEMFGVRVGPNDRPSFGLRGTGLHPSDPLPDDEDYDLFVIGGTV